MQKVLRLFVFWGLFMLAALRAAASPGLGEPKTLLFLRNHIGIESGFSVLRVEALSEKGQGNMRLSCRPGMYLGFKYHVNLNDYFSLRFGPQLGLHAFRFDFDPGKSDSVAYAPVELAVVKPYMALPMEVSVRFVLHTRHVLGAVVGASLNLYSAEKVTASTSLSGNVYGQERYRMALQYQRANPFVNLEAGLEYHWVLRDMNMVKFGLRYSLGLKPLFYAEYTHSDNDFVLSSGSFTSYNDYVSLSVGYVFTRVNKLLDK